MAEAEAGEATDTGTPAATDAAAGAAGQEAPPTEAPATNGQTNGAAADGAPAGAGEAGETSWRDGIPEEMRKAAEQFTSPTALLKSYGDLRKQFNKMAPTLGEKPSDEDLAKYRKAIGIPEAPDGYGIEPPEWFDDRGKENLTDFMAKAHGLNLTPAQVKGAVDAYAGYMQAAAEAEIAAVNAHTEAGMKALKDEWGTDTEANLAVAERALSHFGGADLAEELKGLKLEGGGVAASHPAIVKLLAEVGRAASEPTGVHVPLTTSAEQQETLQERQDELIQSDDYWSNPAKQKESARISEKLHGKIPHSGAGISAL